MRTLFFILSLCFCSLLFSESHGDVQVDLNHPQYEDGVLTTTQGGVVKSDHIRIQAKEITYTKKGDTWRIKARGDLLVHYGGKHFVGESLEYNFETREGEITAGRTRIGNWYLGGERMRLTKDQTYELKGMYLTTCAGESNLWQLHMRSGRVEDRDLLTAKNVQVQLFKIPIFWLPYFRAKLSTLKDVIAKYEFITGGTVGDRVSMRYQLYSWRDLKVFLQGDYWFTRGPSASLQFDYEIPSYPFDFKANNFTAFDYHGAHPYGTFRYRFVGELNAKFFDKLEVFGQYDKLSDDNVLETYFNRNYFLQIERRTRVHMRLPQDRWLATLRTEVRINPFDIVSQELPLFYFNLMPIAYPNFPLIADLNLNAGYLDFVFGNVLQNSPENFRSPRIEFRPRLALPVHLGPVNLFGSAEYIGIGYGQSPQKDALWSSLGHLHAGANLPISRKFSPSLKHVIEPYTCYDFYSRPTVSFEDHYLFNMQDSYVKLNQLRWGLKSLIYYKSDDGLHLPLALDVFAYGFFNNTTIGSYIPKMYLNVSSRWSNLYLELLSAYNFQHERIDYSNAKVAYTFNENFAISASFFHRSRYHFRKADHDSFFLDVYRSQADLLASPLSDPRDTLLTSVYVRPFERIILEFKSRTGWNRPFEPYYNEVFFTLTVLLPCNWKFHFTPRRTVPEGWRWDFRFELGETPPNSREAPYIYW